VLPLAVLLAGPACASHVTDSRAKGGSAGVSEPVATAGAPDTEELPPPAPIFGWCDAQPILAVKCGRCHGNPAQNGAPFSLSEYADTQRVDNRGKPRYERMQAAIETELMPAQFVMLEPPVEPLSETERQQLLDWLAAAAPFGDGEACVATP
jgi:hypothetical protein